MNKLLMCMVLMNNMNAKEYMSQNTKKLVIKTLKISAVIAVVCGVAIGGEYYRHYRTNHYSFSTNPLRKGVCSIKAIIDKQNFAKNYKQYMKNERQAIRLDLVKDVDSKMAKIKEEILQFYKTDPVMQIAVAKERAIREDLEACIKRDLSYYLDDVKNGRAYWPDDVKNEEHMIALINSYAFALVIINIFADKTDPTLIDIYSLLRKHMNTCYWEVYESAVDEHK